MPLILNIDTSSANAYVFLADGKQLLAAEQNNEQKNHASFLEPAIQRLFKTAGLSIKQLDAVAVVSGPGSYTGLRVGVATAKGLCYALGKPLVFLNTLDLMARAIYGTNTGKTAFYCPMIDARRMEVYTALFDHLGNKVKATSAEIIDEHSFTEQLQNNKILFFGDGADKCKQVLNSANALFLDGYINSAAHLTKKAAQKFADSAFEDVAYYEPYYLKDFIAGKKSL